MNHQKIPPIPAPRATRPAPPPPTHHQQQQPVYHQFNGVHLVNLPQPQSPEQVTLLNYGASKKEPTTPKRTWTKTKIFCCVIPVLVILVILIVIGVIFYQNYDLTGSGTQNVTEVGLLTTLLPSTTTPIPEMKRRQNLVRQMAKESWNAYTKYAWGHDALRPVSREPYAELFGKHSGLGIVSALSSLWIMGLKEEFEVGRKWVDEKLSFRSIKKEVDVQHSVNYYVGGLVAAYALTGDRMFLNKSKEVADILDPAYRSKTGLPYWKLKPKSGEASLKTPFLSSIGGQHLEYTYLAYLTGNHTYSDRAQTIRTFLSSITKPQNLYMTQLDIESGSWHTQTATLFTSSRTYFSYLIKSYIQSNHLDSSALEIYQKAMDAIYRNNLVKNSSTGFLYTTNYNLNQKFHTYDKYMNVDACSLGAMLSLGAEQMPEKYQKDKERHWSWALGLTETCTSNALETATKLAPYRFYYDYKEEDEVNMVDSGRYVLSPELAETYFILYRLTHNAKYRDLAWDLAQSLYTHCRLPESGYSRLKDVNQIPTEKANLQDVDFLAATLKYLYLTFAEDDEFDLKKWIFNVKGQPLPIM